MIIKINTWDALLKFVQRSEINTVRQGPASEMTYTVSGGALNSTQSSLGKGSNI